MIYWQYNAPKRELAAAPQGVLMADPMLDLLDHLGACHPPVGSPCPPPLLHLPLFSQRGAWGVNVG